MKFTHQVAVFDIDGVIVSQAFWYVLCDPFLIFDTGLVRLQQLLQRLFELAELKPLVVK